jgi:hypothetical protein
MADEKQGEKTLEMRVAELEDKLKGLQVTEEEMRTYSKVASLMGTAQLGTSVAAAPAVGLTPGPDSCVVSQCIRACTVVSQCIRACTVVSQCIRACTIIQDCINECGGGCAPGGGGFLGGGGFGSLGG